MADQAPRTFDDKLSRISAFAGSPSFGLSASLFHAYIACLTLPELCEALFRHLGSDAKIRRPLRNRLVKIASESVGESQPEELVRRLLATTSNVAAERRSIDATLSHLYPHLLPQTRAAVLDRWKGRGTRGAAARWLKAITNDPLLFSIDEILSYWRVSNDDDAAKVLATRGDRTVLKDVLPELVDRCSQGWIIGRAAMNAAAVADPEWIQIRDKFPATYAYLCAKLHRQITGEQAIALVRAASSTHSSWPTNDAGLAIWAIGQMGMWDALDRVRDLVPELEAQALAKIGLERPPNGAPD